MNARLPLSRAELAELHRVRPLRSLAAIAAELGTIVASIWIAESCAWWPVTLAAIFVIGTRQHGLLVLMHEGVHQGLFRRRWLNDGLSRVLLAWPMLVSFSSYRDNHLAHHRHTNTERDPDWLRYADDPHMSFPMPRARLAWLLLSDLLGLRTLEQLRKLWTFGRAKPTTQPGASGLAAARLAYYLAIALLLSWAQAWPGLLVYWVVPLLSSLKFVLRVRLIAEHYGIPDEQGTRTVLGTPLDRLLIAPHGINFHAEHHRYAAVRFHQLAGFHRRLQRERPGWTPLCASYLDVLRECTQLAAGGHPGSS